MPDSDFLEPLIDRIAEAVVAKIEEHRKIDLLAEAVLARLQEHPEGEGSATIRDDEDTGGVAS